MNPKEKLLPFLLEGPAGARKEVTLSEAVGEPVSIVASEGTQESAQESSQQRREHCWMP